MIIYIDEDFRCFLESRTGRIPTQADFFDGKCKTYIEGMRFVPAVQTWTRDDGVQFAGEMVAPWKDYAELDAAQREYERQLLTDAEADNAAYQAALAELGVTV